MFDSNHFYIHVKATLDTTDFKTLSNHPLYVFRDKDIHNPKMEFQITLLPVFPNLFSCVYFLFKRFDNRR